MAKEVVTTSILMIAAVVAATVAITVMMPAVRDLANSYVSVSGKLNDRIETDAEIIFIKASSGTGTTVDIWMKNLGKTINIDLLSRGDIFLYNQSFYRHISSFSVSIENGDADSYWERGETARISFSIEDQLSGEYTVVYVFYNGVRISETFSV
jgi:flagellar protein FlaG